MQESHAYISENRLHTPHPGDGVLGLHPIISEVQRNMKRVPMNTAENAPTHCPPFPPHPHPQSSLQEHLRDSCQQPATRQGYFMIKSAFQAFS